MRKKLQWMLILISVTGTLFAQDSKYVSGEDKTFGLPPYSIEREFWIDLGKGNRLKIELGDMAGLDRLSNIDSLLIVFFSDMRSFRDSLNDPLASKRIDYVLDPSGRKKIRIRQSRPPGSVYVVDQGEPASLKLEQDTINIMLITKRPAVSAKDSANTKLQYDRLCFYVNQYNELESYVTGGLGKKLRLIRQKTRYNWDWDAITKNGKRAMTADPSIYVEKNKGYLAHSNDLLILSASAGIQNYKNYFSPSFSLGARVHLNNGFSLHDHHALASHNISLTWEPLFIFAHDASGRLQTYRNDFIVLSYSLNAADENDHSMAEIFRPNISVGYLIHREGNFVDQNTFRVTTGRLNVLRGSAFIEPAVYFNNLFKGVTPGLRLVKYF